MTVAGLFVVGVLVGVLGTHLYYAHLLQDPGVPERLGARRLISLIERELDLSSDQLASIEEILRESRAEGRAIHEDLLPRVQEHLEDTKMRISEVLTPEQREKFEELHRLHRRSSEHWFLGRGLGPPPHSPRRGRGRGGRPRIEADPPPGTDPPPQTD